MQFLQKHLSELEIIQNPAFGAYMIWKFALGFQSEDTNPVQLPLVFLLLPLLLHKPTLEIINSTRKNSGLILFAAKLGEERENLLAVHERALVLRKLTLQSIGIGVEAGLLTIDYSKATLRANTYESKIKKPFLPERIKGFPVAAEKLGYWFSKVGIKQIAIILNVEF